MRRAFDHRGSRALIVLRVVLLLVPGLLALSIFAGRGLVGTLGTEEGRAEERPRDQRPTLDAGVVRVPPVGDEQSRIDLDLSRPATPLEEGQRNRINLARPGTGRTNSPTDTRPQPSPATPGGADIDVAFSRVIPSVAELALELPGALQDAGGASAAAYAAFAAVDEGLAAVDDRLQWLLSTPGTSGRVPLPDAPDGLVCRRWDGRDPHSVWRLTSCVLDPLAGRYRFVLEGGRTDDDAAAAAGEVLHLIAQGEVEGRGALPALLGRVGFDLGALADVEETELDGRISVGFRLEGEVRRLSVVLDDYRPPRGILPPGLERLPDGAWTVDTLRDRGGRARILTSADLLRGKPGAARAGRDGRFEVAGLAVAWTDAGPARVRALACAPGASGCAELAECADRRGARQTTRTGARLGQPIAWPRGCPDTPWPVEVPPDPRVRGTDRGAVTRELPSSSAVIPPPLAADLAS